MGQERCISKLRQRRFRHIADRQRSGMLAPGNLQRGYRIDGSSGLRKKNRQLLRRNHRVAITILAGEIDFHIDGRHALEHEFAHHSSVTAGAAGGDCNFRERPYLV